MKFTSQNNVTTVKLVYESCYGIYMKKEQYVKKSIHAIIFMLNHFL